MSTVIFFAILFSLLLQEVALLKNEEGFVSLKKIKEKPTKRISRLIKKYYWN